MNYTVAQAVVDDSLLFWSGLQCFFGRPAVEQLWPSEADFFWRKWVAHDRDPVRFYQSLDPNNKRKLVGWYNEYVQTRCAEYD